MKRSQYLLPTQKNDPTGVEIASHRLMLRAGMIRQLAAGIYDILPLGLKALRKVENIVRQEMNRAGAMEVSLPYVQPADIWKETGRWDGNGKELLRFKDRHDRDFCLGPTHEEVITELVRGSVKSYKDLPINLYQIQLKFRDEIRPRFGLMRGREFVMKDAYSFDASWEALDASYQAMSKAYHQIFERCGLTFRSVQADSGNIGGSASEEFMVLASSGEDAVVSTPSGSYAANLEKAQSREFIDQLPKQKFTSKEKIATPNAKTIEDVCKQLDVHPKETLKTLFYKVDDHLMAFVLPGDRQVNELALPQITHAKKIHPVSEKEMQSVSSVTFGSFGPVGLEKAVPNLKAIYIDTLVYESRQYCVGANENGFHLTGVTPGKDFPMTNCAHFHLAQAGDRCIDNDEPLQIDRGIEVGHIFKLGTKYSEAMNAMFLDENGKSKPFVMGCYGIGVGRTLAAAIEQNHDEDGIIFPPQLAPFDIVLLPVKYKDEVMKKATDELYAELTAKGFDVLMDDRDVGLGAKYKDADLIGIPVAITIGTKGIEQGVVEVKLRWKNEKEMIQPDQLQSWIEKELSTFKTKK